VTDKNVSCGKKIIGLLFVFIALITFNFNPGFAAEAPEGFYLIQAQNGVQLYRKDYPGGAPDFVQVVDLSVGAAIKPLHGAISDLGVGQGVYEGNDAHFRSRSLADYWQSLVAENPTAFCVTNGQFFYMLEYPTRLPFPLKVDGTILTDGYGIKDFPGKKLMLELWPGRADIVPLSKEALLTSSAPDIIAGLTEDAPKRIKFAVGRTFFGVADKNGEGTYQTVLVFNSRISRQEEAANVLRSFGAEKVMMLDGGGSTQLSCEGKSYVYSDRLIPQAIGIMAAPAGAVVRIESTPLVPPPRVAITSPELSPSLQSSDGMSAALQEAQPSPTSVEQAQAQLPILSQTAPAQTPLATAHDPLVTPTPTNIPPKEQVLNQYQEQSDLLVPTVTPPQGQTSAPNLVQENKKTLAMLQTNGSEKQPIVGRSASKESNPLAQKVPPVGEASIQIVNVVWVPLSMSPALLFLLIVVFKIRGPHN